MPKESELDKFDIGERLRELQKEEGREERARFGGGGAEGVAGVKLVTKNFYAALSLCVWGDAPHTKAGYVFMAHGGGVRKGYRCKECPATGTAGSNCNCFRAPIFWLGGMIEITDKL